MLTTDDLEEYLRIAEKAKAAGGFCIRVTPEHAITLLRVYEAVLAAPEVATVGHDECDSLPIIFAPDGCEVGDRFRLVPLATAKGEQ